MENEVAKHECYRNDGKEEILNDQRQEEFQRENDSSKVHSTSKILRITILSLNQLLNFPGKNL